MHHRTLIGVLGFAAFTIVCLLNAVHTWQAKPRDPSLPQGSLANQVAWGYLQNRLKWGRSAVAFCGFFGGMAVVALAHYGLQVATSHVDRLLLLGFGGLGIICCAGSFVFMFTLRYSLKPRALLPPQYRGDFQ